MMWPKWLVYLIPVYDTNFCFLCIKAIKYLCGGTCLNDENLELPFEYIMKIQ